MPDRSRRQFLKSTAGIIVAAPALLLSGCGGDTVDRELTYTSFAEALTEAERLVSKNVTLPSGSFTLAQTLVHCAQSIEYSMAGFPEAKSAFFQNTVGSAAFSVFSWKGRMSHDLTEGIPGAPSLDAYTDTESAILRLHESVKAFVATENALKPHFAYGELSKSDYQMAHILHLANHFSAIDA